MNRRDFMRMTGLGMMAAGMPFVVRTEEPAARKKRAAASSKGKDDAKAKGSAKEQGEE